MKVGWVLAKKAPFLFWSEETGLTTPHQGLRPHSPRVTPAHPDGLHITGSRTGRARTRAGNQGRPRKARHTRLDAGHAAPVYTRYQTGNARQIVPEAGRWRAWSVSETEQIRTHTSRLV